MVVKFTVEHTIEQGKEGQALKLVKELNQRENGHLPSLPRQTQWLQATSQKPDTADLYHKHLKCLSLLDPLSNTPARIRVHLAAGE